MTGKKSQPIAPPRKKLLSKNATVLRLKLLESKVKVKVTAEPEEETGTSPLFPLPAPPPPPHLTSHPPLPSPAPHSHLTSHPAPASASPRPLRSPTPAPSSATPSHRGPHIVDAYAAINAAKPQPRRVSAVKQPLGLQRPASTLRVGGATTATARGRRPSRTASGRRITSAADAKSESSSKSSDGGDLDRECSFWLDNLDVEALTYELSPSDRRSRRQRQQVDRGTTPTQTRVETFRLSDEDDDDDDVIDVASSAVASSSPGKLDDHNNNSNVTPLTEVENEIRMGLRLNAERRRKLESNRVVKLDSTPYGTLPRGGGERVVIIIKNIS